MRSLVQCVLIVSCARFVSAQEPDEKEKKLGWWNVADLSYVITSGNTSSSTLAFDDTLGYAWEKSDFLLRAGGLRTRTAGERFAVGTPDDFDVIDPQPSELDNERYYVKGQYQRNFSDRFYWLAGAGWDRDKDQGIDYRTVAFGGLGNVWLDSQRTRFKTDYGVTITRRVDEIPDPERKESFSEGRASVDFMHELNDAHQIDSDFVFFIRVDRAPDNRFDTIHVLTSKLNQYFALRFSVRFLYQNLPALESIELLDPSGASLGSVSVRKKKLDSVLKFSFVVTL